LPARCGFLASCAKPADKPLRKTPGHGGLRGTRYRSVGIDDVQEGLS
jgi:hypothetical protein